MKKKRLVSLLVMLLLVLGVCFWGHSWISDRTMEGYYLQTDKGHHMIVDQYGGLIDVHGFFGDFIFKDLSTGDQVQFAAGSIMETYPAQASIYFCKKTADGNQDNIPENAWFDLKEMGYME